jgi:DNA-binding NarL/FixJ family response regulator
MPGNGVPVPVLVVDDHPAARDLLRSMIDGIDLFALVGEAASGEEALEAAAELSPRLVVMDRRMPGIDGLEATRRLKARHPEMVIVLTSAEDVPPQVIAASGAASFIHKHLLSGRRLLDVWEAHVT